MYVQDLKSLSLSLFSSPKLCDYLHVFDSFSQNLNLTVDLSDLELYIIYVLKTYKHFIHVVKNINLKISLRGSVFYEIRKERKRVHPPPYTHERQTHIKSMKRT